MTEWRELKTLQDVAAAQAEGWEVEFQTKFYGWGKWDGGAWSNLYHYRGRPRRPKMNKHIEDAWNEAAKAFHGRGISWEVQKQFMEEFGRLVAKESARVCEDRYAQHKDLSPQSAEAMACSMAILEHFGLDE